MQPLSCNPTLGWLTGMAVTELMLQGSRNKCPLHACYACLYGSQAQAQAQALRRHVMTVAMTCRPGGRQDKRLRELLGGCISTLLALQHNMGDSKLLGPGNLKTEDDAPPEQSAGQPDMQLLNDAVDKLQPVHPSNQEPYAAILSTMVALKTAVTAP